MTNPRAAHTLQVNDRSVTIEADPAMPLLWALRELVGLTGTKFGCGIAQCGACTVLVDGTAARSCVTPLAAVAGKAIRTVEGLTATAAGARVRAAWAAENVPQCGYCQSGMQVEAAALLARNPQPTDDAVEQALGGHICRCGTYLRIRRAIARAAGASS